MRGWMCVCVGGEWRGVRNSLHHVLLFSSSALHLNPVLAPRSVHSQTTFATFKSNSDGTLTVAVIKQKIQVQVSHPLSPCAKSPPGDRAASAAVPLVSCEEGRRALHALSSPAATFLNCVYARAHEYFRVRVRLRFPSAALDQASAQSREPRRRVKACVVCARSMRRAQSALTCELHEINGRVTCIQLCTVCA